MNEIDNGGVVISGAMLESAKRHLKYGIDVLEGRADDASHMPPEERARRQMKRALFALSVDER